MKRDECGFGGVNLEAGGNLRVRWLQALDELAGCIRVVGDGPMPVLCEGGNYPGSWIESTGTISTEVLDRFAPDVSRATHLAFARHCRADGLMPYKLTDDGPGFSQIQIVTPLARSVWKHYRLTGAPTEYLQTMYDAMVGMDGWLAANRDTRGTGGVEAFCTFDTGHDLSPRFWLVPDRCPDGDAARYDTSNPNLPYIAPDLTANVACQRAYLAKIAQELASSGDTPDLSSCDTPDLSSCDTPDPSSCIAPIPSSCAKSQDLAAQSDRALWEQCFDAADDCFYDRLPDGEFLRIQSDVLLRVLACEVGDDAFFERALDRYLMNTSKFLSPYGFTSLSLDDPRFDHDYTHNSWGGPVNFLAMLRAPQAFECHGRVAELALVEQSVLTAMLATDRFPQCLDPWTGSPGFTDHYSPAILWLLDAVERNMGILPRPDGDIWFTGLATEPLTYTRTVASVSYTMVCDGTGVEVTTDGAPWLTFPAGWRVVVRDGDVRAVVGMSAGETIGTLTARGVVTQLTLPPNHIARFSNGQLSDIQTRRFIPPHA